MSKKPGAIQSCSVSATSSTSPLFSLKRLAASLLLAGIPGWASAELLVDPAAGGTHVITAPNGVPVIEIANPNNSGLSHNRFSEFDVVKPGVIFNNSRANGVSQLGGAILGNPNLQRSATAILSEVTGTKPSSLSGALEVFGGRADILIAKPFDPKSSDTASGVHDRNKFMARKLNKADLIAPGNIGLFGAAHLKQQLVGSKIKPGLHQLANIDELRTYDLAPAFHDWDIGETYPRWPELNRELVPNVRTREGEVVPFILDTRRKLSVFQRQPHYVEAPYKNRVIIDRSNTPESAALTDLLLQKHPFNTIAFTDFSGVLDYKAGYSTDESRARYNGKQSKIYVLREPEQAPSSTGDIRADLRRKFGHEMATIVVEDRPIEREDAAQSGENQ